MSHLLRPHKNPKVTEALFVTTCLMKLMENTSIFLSVLLFISCVSPELEMKVKSLCLWNKHMRVITKVTCESTSAKYISESTSPKTKQVLIQIHLCSVWVLGDERNEDEMEKEESINQAFC